MTFFFTCLYAVFVFLRPQEWMFPWMASYEPVNIIAILALASLVFEILAGFIKIPERLPHFWLQLGVMLGVIMSHAAHTYLLGIIGAIVDPIFWTTG